MGEMAPVESVTLHEDFSAPCTLRKAWWIASLTKKEIQRFWHKSDKDADTILKQWDRFIGDRLSNIRKKDYRNEGIEVDANNNIYFLRTYQHSSTSNGCPGRLYCHTSLQSLPRPMRNLLLEDTSSDIDQVNSSITFLCWLAKKYECSYLLLKSYRDDRENWFRESAIEDGWTKRYCKEFVIRHIFNSKPDDRIKKTWRGLIMEIYAIKKKLYKEAELSWALRHCTCENPLGTFINVVIFAMESKLTSECVKYAQNTLKWKIQAIVHDGFNPMGKFTEEDTGPLDDFEYIGNQLFPGLDMKWAWKEFDLKIYDKKTGEVLTDPHDPERRPRIFRPPADWQPKEESEENEEDYKTDDDDFEGDAEFEPSYPVQKKKIEEWLFKVSELYADYQKEKNGRLNMISRSVLNERFEEKAYSKKVSRETSEGKVWERKNFPFLNKWRRDPHIRKYIRMVCDPTNSHDKETELNTWEGYEVDRITKDHDWAKGKELVLFYLRFQKYLFCSKKQVEFGLDWESHLFALPEEKPGIMPCLLGEQGGGKSTFIQTLHNMMGDALVMTSPRPENDFYGQNGTICILGKKLLNCQECGKEAMARHVDAMKPLISDPIIRCKGMCKDPIPIESIHATILSSNSLDGPPDNDKERRFWTPLCTTAWKEYKDPEKKIPWASADEKAKFFAWINNEVITDPDFQVHYAMYLRARAYNEDGTLRIPKRFVIEHVPMGKLQTTIRSQNKKWIELYLYDLIADYENVDKDGWIDYSITDLTERLTSFSERQKWEDDKNERSLTTKLSYMKLTWDGIKGGNEEYRKWDSKLHKNVNYWSFDLDYMRDRLKSFSDALYGLDNKIYNMREPQFFGISNATMQAQKEITRYKVERSILECEKDLILDEKAKFDDSLRFVMDEVEEDWDYEADYEHYMGRKYRENVRPTISFAIYAWFCIHMKRLGKQRHERKQY
jgi:hypothetical protein